MKTRLLITLLGALLAGTVGLSGNALAQGNGGGGGAVAVAVAEVAVAPRHQTTAT